MPTIDSTTAPAENLAGFADLGLSKQVLAAVDDLGYELPSPVQREAIPHVMAGSDLLAAAQTGTGKTAAFLLPVLSRLGHARHGQGPLMLVVTPTRELAQQIEACARVIAKRTNHNCVTVVGGVGYEPQKKGLKRGCDVLVATPGRLVDLIDQGCCNLSQVEVLVLDEADRMLDMGFLPAMRQIVGKTPDSRQTLLFSATLDDSAIGGISDLVTDPARVEIARKGTVAETIEQFCLPVSTEAKNALLGQVLQAEGASHVIVFTRTKHRADACCRRLRRAGISCAPIHGDRSQNQRERALKEFRTDKVDVLVATDVLARGIDVSDVRYVVNFDVPADPEDYIHRIGRTGRAGEDGWALTFVTNDDIDDLMQIERLMQQIVPLYVAPVAIDRGENPPALDPNRVPASRGGNRKGDGKGTRKKKRGRSGRKRTGNAPSEAPTVSVAAASSRRQEGSKPKPRPKAKPKPKSERNERTERPAAKQGKPAKGKHQRHTSRDDSPRRDERRGDNRSRAAAPATKHTRRPGDKGGRR